MLSKNIFSKRKYFFLSGGFLLLILLLGIIEPVILKNSESSWGDNLDSKILDIKRGLKEYFAGEEKSLIKNISLLKQSLLTGTDSAGFNGIITSAKWQNEAIIILNSNNNIIASSNFTDKPDVIPLTEITPGKMFFLQSSLIDYLSIGEDLKIGNNSYKLILGKAVEKKYSLNTAGFIPISIKEDLSRKFETIIDIFPGKGEIEIMDGRLQQLNIFNSGDEKIATVQFENPSLSNELDRRRELISFLQIICVLIIILLLLKKIKESINHINSKALQTLFVISIIVLLRVLFFIFEIPSRFANGQLTDASNFSSQFGFGIVRSPLELFLTIISILAIAIIIYENIHTLNDNLLSNKKKAKVLISAALIIFYILLLRAFGASVRSVVFDSTLKYFKDPFIIPDLPSFVMHLNILFIGLSAVVFSLSLLILLSKFLKERKEKLLFIIFLIFQSGAYLFDLIQSDPQGNDLTRVLYILFTFSLAYWVLKNRVGSIFKYSIFLIIASFLSILLLIYYNKGLEKISLPTTAQEFLKRNEKLNEFMAIQTAVQFTKEKELLESVHSGKKDFNALVFKLWSKSMLQKEMMSAHISLYDKDFNEQGHYDYNFNFHKKIEWKPENEKDYFVKDIIEPYSSQRLFAVLARVKSHDSTLSYVELVLPPLNDYFGIKQSYNILSSYNQRLNSTVDFEQLKIFLIEGQKIKKTIGDIPLDGPDIKYFEDYLKTNGDEVYTEREIEGKEYLIFLRNNLSESGEGILGVALRTRNITLDLFDFFKVFFIHSIIILVFTVIVFVIQIRKMWRALLNFRARLLYSLIIISIVPLFLSAVYFKSLVGEKNLEEVNYKLNKRALQLERFIQAYSVQSTLQQDELFEKAHRDLGMEFSLFDSENLSYSTTPGFYNSTLISQRLNSSVIEKLFNKNRKQVLVQEKIDYYTYNSFYLKTQLGGKDIFINVNDAFNELSLSLSNLEVDIFLFGSYSFAAVMIIIFSSFLAGQISKPIRILTKATSAVAEGDLDVSVEYKDRGEINDLIVGFNEMVLKLKKSQLDLAEFERETAWKEMAKQVAHEIKNPLTPMKLSIQQLIASYNDKSPKFNSIFEKVTPTIIGQIETLSKIASEFSGFARMPKMKIEKVELLKICKEAVYLFDNDLKIKISCAKDSVDIMADSDHLKRSFINLIRNSIQANARQMEIRITESEHNVEIRLADDGHGISKENVEKVFDENFTTKEKGMGIGLNMAKKYFESLNGSISVAENTQKGAEFIIVIPKAVS